MGYMFDRKKIEARSLDAKDFRSFADDATKAKGVARNADRFPPVDLLLDRCLNAPQLVAAAA